MAIVSIKHSEAYTNSQRHRYPETYMDSEKYWFTEKCQSHFSGHVMQLSRLLLTLELKRIQTLSNPSPDR